MMTEFNKGIFKTITDTSIGRAFVYTIGHILIAMICVRILTGASWFIAGIDALIEPVINGFWYYFLDRTWSKSRG